MKTLTRLAIAVSLAVIASGCMTSRSVELKAFRADATPAHTNGVTGDAGAEIFQDVAKQMGFQVKGPETVSHAMTEYVAQAQQRTPADSRVLLLWIEPKRLRFVSSMHCGAKVWPVVMEGADRFASALKARHVDYTRKKIIAFPPP